MARNRLNLANFGESFKERFLVSTGILFQVIQGFLAYATTRYVKYPFQIKRIQGIDYNPQVGQNVLYLLPLIESDTSHNGIIYFSFPEGIFQNSRLGVRPIEHSKVLKNVPFFHQSDYFFYHEISLVDFAIHQGILHRHTFFPICPQFLFLSISVVLDHLPGHIKNVFCRPVILLQFHNFNIFIVPFEM